MASSVIAATRAPGALSSRSTTEVRSAPVRFGGRPGAPTSTNRVRALASSTTSPARTCSPYRWAASAVVTAASAWPAATSLAAAAFELAGTSSVFGRWAASQCLTWAAATGNAATVCTSLAAVAGRTAMVKHTSSVSSAKICRGASAARLSSVGDTDPSIEFSIGTTA